MLYSLYFVRFSGRFKAVSAGYRFAAVAIIFSLGYLWPDLPTCTLRQPVSSQARQKEFLHGIAENILLVRNTKDFRIKMACLVLVLYVYNTTSVSVWSLAMFVVWRFRLCTITP